MAIIVVSTPPAISLDRERMVYCISSGYFDEPFFKIKAEPVPGIEEFGSLNADDEAWFDLHEYYKAELETELAIDQAKLHVNGSKQFKVWFREHYGVPPQDEASAYYDIEVVWGAIPKWVQGEFYSSYSSFHNRLSSNRVQSFWVESARKRVFKTQPEMLYILHPGSGGGGGLSSPTVVIRYTDGTTANYTASHIVISAQLNQLFSVPVGYNALKLGEVNPSKVINSYDVTIGGQTRYYKVDHTNHRNLKYIAFRNSLGGYDVLPMTGEWEYIPETERSYWNRMFDPEQSSPQKDKMVRIKDVGLRVRQNSGWLDDQEMRLLNELMISDDVYEVSSSGAVTPIIIETDSMDIPQREYEPGSVEIEYERVGYLR